MHVLKNVCYFWNSVVKYYSNNIKGELIMEKIKRGKIATFLSGLLTGGIGTYIGALGLANLGVQLYGATSIAQVGAMLALNPVPILTGIGAVAIGGLCIGIAGKTIARNVRTIRNESKMADVNYNTPKKKMDVRVKTQPLEQKAVTKQKQTDEIIR